MLKEIFGLVAEKQTNIPILLFLLLLFFIYDDLNIFEDVIINVNKEEKKQQP